MVRVISSEKRTEEDKTLIQKDTRTPVLTAALFTTVRRGSNPMSIHGRKDTKDVVGMSVCSHCGNGREGPQKTSARAVTGSRTPLLDTQPDKAVT